MRPHPAAHPLLARLFHALLLVAALASFAAGAPADPRVEFTARLDRIRHEFDTNQFAAAESLARPLVAEAEQRFGARDPLTNDAIDLYVGGAWHIGFAPDPAIRQLAERGLALRDTSAAHVDERVCLTLENAAQVRMQNGDLEGAQPLIERLITLRGRWPGRDSILYTYALNARSACALIAGRFDDARRDDEEIDRIRERRLAPDDPLVAWGYSNLAYIEQNAGDLVRARELFRIAVHRFETGRTPPSDLAHGLKNLAQVEAALGDTARARALLERALHIRESIRPESGDVANSLNDIAALLRDSGHPDEARPLAEHALAIRTRIYGPDHPETATSLLTVASLRLEAGDPVAARVDIERAVAIRERVFGPVNSSTARALDRLVGALIACGRADSACRVAERALAIKQATLGARHPDLANSWLAYAKALHAAGRDSAAFDAALAAETVAREHLVVALTTLPENEALAYESTRVSGLDLALALALAHPDPHRVRAAWDAVVRARACVLDEMSARARENGGTTDATLRVLHERERAARRRLAQALRTVPGGRDSTWRRSLERTRHECDEAERACAAHDPGYRENRARLGAGFEAIARAQPAHSALVAYVRTTDPLAPEPRATRYLVFVRHAHDQRLTMLSLGAAKLIDAAITRWRAAVTRNTSEAEERASGERLRRAIWDPLKSAIGDAALVLVVPDGAVVGVDLYGLPDPAGGYLVERGPLLHLLGAERDLTLSPPVGPDARLVAFGGMSFGESGQREALVALPQSRHEVDDVAAVWDSTLHGTRHRAAARVLTGEQATLGAFRALAPGASVLHVATHALSSEAGAAVGPATVSGALAPMLGAGLAFSTGPHGKDGGVLSAAEAAMLDLDRTRWLVLSGCDTGSGPVAGREGVLGLRRAFAIAGARTQIVSVWGVRDDDCRQWMRALYHARFVEGRSTAEAARDASRRLLARRRALRLPPSPGCWAGFVAVGDWR